MTGDFTCPDNYEPILISSITHQFPDRTEQHSYQKCHTRWFKKKCSTVYYSVVMKDQVQLQNYWCRAKPGVTIPENSGALFGGIYTSTMVNVFTGGASCPGTYMSYRLFADVTVCVSYDYQEDTKFAVPLGGFFSCQSTQMRCDDGYTQHLIEVYDNCAIFYCVTPSAYLSLDDPVIKRPPFSDAALAASNHSQNIILAYYNEEQSVGMPVLDVMINYTEHKSEMIEGVQKTVFAVEDVEEAIEAYMNETSEQILELIEQYPNMTWGQIEGLLADPAPSSSSFFKVDTK